MSQSTNDPDALTLAPVTQDVKPQGFIARHAFPILLLGLVGSGFSPIFVRLSEVGPIATGANRLTLPVPLFFALLWLRPQDRVASTSTQPRHDMWLLLLSGVFFCCDLLFWNSSVMITSVANAAVLANITPVFVVAGGWILFKDKPGKLFLVGLAIALVGSAIMMAQSLALGGRSVVGDLSAVVAAAFYSGYVLTLSRVRKRVSVTATMAYGGTMSAVLLIAAAVVMEPQLWPHTFHGWMVAVGMVVLAQLAGQMLIAASLAHVPAGLAAALFLLQPVIPAGAAWVLFGEKVTLYQVLGSIALLTGLEISRRGTIKPGTLKKA